MKIRRYWKTAVKGVIYNQEKHIRDLKFCGGISEEAVDGGTVLEGAVLGGTTIYSVVHHGQIKQLVHT